MKFQPLGDYILIEVPKKEEKTASGIFLPSTIQADKPQTGIVVAVGQGKYNEKGERIPMEVKIGDEIMFAKYMGTELKINGAEYLVLSERDIHGIFIKEQ